MKYFLVIIFLFFPSLVFLQIKEFGWLIGSWQVENKRSFEVWKSENGYLLGVAYKIDDKGSETLSEEIKFIQRGKDFYYIPDIACSQGPIEFKITSFGKNNFVAENPAHDFPKKNYLQPG